MDTNIRTALGIIAWVLYFFYAVTPSVRFCMYCELTQYVWHDIVYRIRYKSETK